MPFKRVILAFALTVSSFASEPIRFDRLISGGIEYQNVIVRSANAISITIQHRKGLAQLSIASLPPEIQQQFGYDAEADRERRLRLLEAKEQRIKSATVTVVQATEFPPEPAAASESQSFRSVTEKFGSPVEFKADVDLRRKYFDLGLGIRDQGKRPSCAIHCIISSIELQKGVASGEGENLSESYLNWATLKSLGKLPDTNSMFRAVEEDEDSGFTLGEVLQAARSYGLATEAETRGKQFVPKDVSAEFLSSIEKRNTVPGSLQKKETLDIPSDQLIADAQKRGNIISVLVPGRDNDTVITNIIHALNGGIPVNIGVAWPNYQTIENTSLLSRQKPEEDSRHAVTLVGYRDGNGTLEGLTFIFRNSWGRKWGTGGYGFMHYEYISENLFDAYLVEIESSSS